MNASAFWQSGRAAPLRPPPSDDTRSENWRSKIPDDNMKIPHPDGLNLGQYAGRFTANGYDSLEHILKLGAAEVEQAAAGGGGQAPGRLRTSAGKDSRLGVASD